MISSLGKLLLDKNVIDSALLETALQECKRRNVRLGEVLQDVHSIDEEDLYKTLAEQFSMPFLKNLETHVDTKLISRLPVELFVDGRCLPLKTNKNQFHIAVSDPLDLDIVFEAEYASDLPVVTSLALPTEIKQIVNDLFKDGNLFKDSAGKIAREFKEQTVIEDDNLSFEDLIKNTESEPVVKMAALIFNEAIDLNASDIHIEPLEDKAVVRFRIDGMLRKHMDMEKWMYNPLTSRIKVLAELDIAEKRAPQDGRIRYEFEGESFDFRVSTLPTHHGEKTVIRVLKHDLSLLDLKNVGVNENEYKSLVDFVNKPQGILFVTGPTGSGKSSTLFACLNIIKDKEINITTIENPIEYKLDGVNQIQINEKAGVTFSSALRSILRQDPDVILVGEIRDRETAEIAIQASQTGHLVLSTLHTNDAISAITRLKDLGIPSYMISSSLLGLLAQRLVRKLCSHCKVEEEIPLDLKKQWERQIGKLPFDNHFIAKGCNKCGNTGYSGRTGIFEIISLNEAVRDKINENVTDNELKHFLTSRGFTTMLDSGLDKIKTGKTTLEEVMRVVLADSIEG